MSRRTSVLLVALLGVGAAALTSRPPPKNRHASEFRPVLLRPTVARTISKPFLPMLIDLYWLRSVNAIGLSDSAEKNRALYEYGEVLTDLDPKFLQPYTFIGLAVPYQYERGKYVNADLSEKLLRKGLAQYPDHLQLNLYLGFNLFSYQARYVDAARVFEHVSKLPISVPWASLLATRLLATGGSPQEGAALAREMADGAEDDATRAEFEQRADELEVEAALQAVDRAAKQYFDLHGVWPETLAALRQANLYAGPDTDPQGGTISVQSDGKATSTSLKRRLEVFQ